MNFKQSVSSHLIVIIVCGGTEFERRGLELRNWRDRLLFWRRMTVKIAAVTKKKGPVT